MYFSATCKSREISGNDESPYRRSRTGPFCIIFVISRVTSANNSRDARDISSINRVSKPCTADLVADTQKKKRQKWRESIREHVVIHYLSTWLLRVHYFDIISSEYVHRIALCSLRDDFPAVLLPCSLRATPPVDSYAKYRCIFSFPFVENSMTFIWTKKKKKGKKRKREKFAQIRR